MSRKIVLLMCIVLMLGLSGNASAALKGWWKLDDGSGSTATDSSGNGYDGTITGAAWVDDGTRGYVLDFEGVDYVAIPSTAVSLTSTVTISLWQYGDTALQPQVNNIFEGTRSGSRTLNAHIPWSNGNLVWDAGYAGTTYDRVNKTATNANQYEGQWNHWAFTKSTSTGQMKMYLNGTVWTSGTGKTKSMSGINLFKIGSAADGSSNYDGMVSDFRVYDTVLTEAEIRALAGWTCTISGTIGSLDEVTLNGLPGDSVTTTGGAYSATVAYNWSGTVTPEKEGYAFSPVNKTYSNVTSNQTSQNYTPTRLTAEDPSPADQAVDVSVDQNLSWTSGALADTVNVYFGTSLDLVNSRDGSVFIGNQSATSYDPGTLAGFTTYYWAIDTINDDYGDSPWAGEVWSFTTINVDLVGYWKLDEGSGTTATDSSGYGNDGTITGAAWVSDGVMGNVLDFEGVDYISIPSAAFSTISNQVTITLWQFGDVALQPQDNSIFQGTKSGGGVVLNSHLPWGTGSIFWDAGYTTTYDRINKAAGSANEYEGQWNHWAFTKDTSTGLMNMYLNGELWHSGTGKTKSMSGVTTFKIGSTASGTNNYDGMVCEFRLYNRALTVDEIRAFVGDNIATEPSPADKAYNVQPNATLTWTAGPLAAETDGHDLYLGTSSTLVAARDASVHIGLLDSPSYTPTLKLSTRYYWAVDEYNPSEPGSPWLGDVWQFTVRSSTEGYYKDIFIDGGAGLTGYKASDIPAVGQIGYTNEHVTANNVNVTRKIMVKANTGSWIDDNGVLLYPDNEPRFRMIYVNGGDSGAHRVNLEPEGTGIMQNFVDHGGCYTGSCAGAWLTGTKTFRWMLSPLVISTTSTGSTYTDGVFPDGVTTFRGRVLPLSPLVAYNPELFGDFKVHGIRHNGGCRCNVETTGWVEGKSEALLLFDMTWTLHYSDPNAEPVDMTIYGSDTQKATHHQCMVWGEKESPEHGKLCPCGSHPEHLTSYGEETALQSAIYQYAFSFNGRATVKAALTDGVARQMNDNATAGHEKIGDKQYHHFTITVPAGADQLQIVLDGNLYDMNLYAKNGDFAFMSEQNVVAAANSTAIDETLTIANPTAGTWYIGVKCNKSVAATNSGSTYSYTDRFELLNGLAYTITATVQE